MNPKSIAVILINYNGYNDTSIAIESVMDSSIHASIIVADNASSNYEGRRLQQSYPNIYVIECQQNLGFAGGNNVCIKYALEEGFDHIILLNNDTIIDSEMIEKLVEGSSENTVTAPIMFYYDNPHKIWFGGGKINRRSGNAEHLLMDQSVSAEVTITNCTFLTGCCICVNRSIFEQVGLLNESYFMYCEDTEFCLRLHQAGIKMVMLPEAKLWHKVSSSTGGEKSYFSIYYITRNRLKYIKNYPEEFNHFAYEYTIFSRLVRMIQHLFTGKKTWKAFARGIVDGKKGIQGRVVL